MKKNLVVLIIFVIFLINISNVFATQMKIDITNTHTFSLNNYTIEFNLPYYAGMQSDFDDIRFTNSKNVTLDFYIFNKIDGVNANIGLKVDNISASAKTSIYLDYGNSGVSTSNRNNIYTNLTIMDSSTSGTEGSDYGTWNGGDYYRAGQTFTIGNTTASYGNWTLLKLAYEQRTSVSSAGTRIVFKTASEGKPTGIAIENFTMPSNNIDHFWYNMSLSSPLIARKGQQYAIYGTGFVSDTNLFAYGIRADCGTFGGGFRFDDYSAKNEATWSVGAGCQNIQIYGQPYWNLTIKLAGESWTSNLTDGLVIYYTFNNNVASSIVTGENLSVSEGTPTYAGGLISNSGNVTDGNNWKGLATTPVFNNVPNRTMNIWLKPSAMITQEILDKYQGASVGWALRGFADGSVDCPFDCGGIATGTGILKTTEWTMITLTQNDTDNCLWVNGILNVCGATTNQRTSTKILQFGNDWGDVAGADYSGLFDENGWWNRTLTATEILTLYNGGNGLITSFGELDLKPSVIFNSQTPTDINSLNVVNSPLNITYNISDDILLNLSTIKIFYKQNSTTRNCITFINGACASEWGIDSYTSNISNTFLFSLQDNDIYPATYNLDDDIFDEEVHTRTALINQNAWVSIELLNVTSSTEYNFFEIMSNGTSVQRLYYCNSSYNFALDTIPDITTSPRCSAITTIPANQVYSHTHTDNSKHQVVTFVINTTTGKTSGGVVVTPKSYFILRGNTPANSIAYYSVNNLSRVGAIRTTTNNGGTYTNQTYTIDAHLHQFSGASSLFYYVCANDTANNQNCSDIRTDLFELAGLPPTSPHIYSPIEATTYKGSININYTQAVSPNGYAITHYNITLLNVDLTFNSTIIGNNGNNLGYFWDISLVANGHYKIQVKAYDSQGQTSSGFSENFTIFLNPFEITSCLELQNMSNNLTGIYTLINNIDCSDTINWNSGAGFVPIGNVTNKFAGSLDGQGYNVTDLFINRITNNIGLFGYVKNAIIKNVGITGEVKGGYSIGGLVGISEYNNISNCFFIGNVTSTGNTAGGLVGHSLTNNISNSYSTGKVTGYISGGLVGWISGGLILNSYSTGEVIGNLSGGLVGWLENYGLILNSYSTAKVSGSNLVGGLVGLLDLGTCTNSYWNKYLSGQSTSACGTELTNSQMLLQSSYINWDFANIWYIQTTSTPYLRISRVPFFPNFPLTQISSIYPVSAVTLNGGTTKNVYIAFDVSDVDIDSSSSQIIITKGAESRTSSSCTNSSRTFNCTITMQFYDSAGSWLINATIKDNNGTSLENSTESFIVNSLDYVTQNVNAIFWTSLTPDTNDNQAGNTITLTNGGNQNYATTQITGQNATGQSLSDIINANRFSVDSSTGQTAGQIYMASNSAIDVSAKLTLNTHSASSTEEIFFYVDVPSGIRADNYLSNSAWTIGLT